MGQERHPKVCRTRAPLHDLMKRTYNRAGKRMKQAISQPHLSAAGWGTTETEALQSDILTQVPRKDLVFAHREQRIAFLSDRFNHNQFCWSTIEKDNYAVLATLERMEWLIATLDGFDLYTDYNILIFLFENLSVVPDLSQTSLRKVLSWAVMLSLYNYTCCHVKDSDSVWADLFSRWAAVNSDLWLVHVPALLSSSDEAFEWTTVPVLKQAQESNVEDRPPTLGSNPTLRFENDP